MKYTITVFYDMFVVCRIIRSLCGGSMYKRVDVMAVRVWCLLGCCHFPIDLVCSFLGVKRPGRGVDHPPPSSAEFKERVELYMYRGCQKFIYFKVIYLLCVYIFWHPLCTSTTPLPGIYALRLPCCKL